MAAGGCSYRMGPNHSWTASQKREVAVGVIEGAGDTEPRREVETSCTITWSATRCKSFEPRRGIDGCKGAGGAARSSVGSVSGVRFCRSPRIEAGVATSKTFSSGAAHQRPNQGHGRFIVSSTKRLEVLAKKRVEEERLLESAKIRLTRLKEMATADRTPSARPTELDTQVAELKAKLAAVEAERDQARRNAERQHEGRQGAVQDTQPQGPAPKRACRREEQASRQSRVPSSVRVTGSESAVVPSTQPVCSLMESDDEPLVRSTGGRNHSFAHEGVPLGPPQEDCNTAVHHRLPSRRLVLVGGGSLSQNRFSPLGHEDDVRATPQLRVMQGEDIPTPTVSGVDPHGIGESDTDIVDGQSDRDPDAVEDVEISPEENTSVPVPPGRVSLGMSSLDEVQLDTIFERRAHVMRSIPHLLKGPYRAAVRLALREATVGRTTGDMLRLTRAWKLFLLLPRMWLSRPPRGGLVPKGRLLERVSLFHNGHWSELVERSVLDSRVSPSCCVPEET